MNIIAMSVPFFLLAILLEWLWGLWRGVNTYRLTDSVSSLTLGGLSQARRFVALGVGGVVYSWAMLVTPIEPWPIEGWMPWVVAFLLYDLCFYCAHRCGHTVALFWAAHVVHHQSEDYNLSTALRQTSSGFLFGWIFYLPLFLIGVPAEVVVVVGALNLVYQFWVHTEHVPELGGLEYVFVTPSNHRVHHAQNDCYLDKNFGGVFIVWDRLFGSYQRELQSEPCIYGITSPLRSWSPLIAWLHVYRDMVIDIWYADNWRDRVRVPFAHPAWQPEASAKQMPRIKADLEQFEKHDPTVTDLRQLSAFCTLLVLTSLLFAGQQVAAAEPWQGAIWFLMLWSGVANAYLMSGRMHAIYRVTELVRLLVVISLAPHFGAFWFVVLTGLAALAWALSLSPAGHSAEPHAITD
jgi:alkylglycerol monooxygenase